MAKRSSLKDFEIALCETHSALGKLIQVLSKTNLVESINSNTIIPYYIFEFHREQRELGHKLDDQYWKLWLRERELVALLREEPDNHEHLQHELEQVQQKMTEIQNQGKGIIKMEISPRLQHPDAATDSRNHHKEMSIRGSEKFF